MNDDTLLYTQLRYDLSLQQYQNYSFKTQSQQTPTSALQNVLIIAAVEFTDDLKQNWIEQKTDLSQLTSEAIKQRFVPNMEASYKAMKYQSVRGFFQPTLNELKKYLSQQQVRQGRFIIHYVGRHGQLQLEDGIVLSQDEQTRTPLSIAITEVAKLMEQPVFVFDCPCAGRLVEALQQSAYDCLSFGACGSNQSLPYMQQLQVTIAPTDLFSFCLLFPLQAAFLGYVQRLHQKELNSFQDVMNVFEQKIERNTSIHKSLKRILQDITECIAWNAIPRKLFMTLCKADNNTGSLVYNFFVAQRVMWIFGCSVCSSIGAKNEAQNSLWSSFDFCFNQVLQHDIKLDNMIELKTRHTSPINSEPVSRTQSSNLLAGAGQNRLETSQTLNDRDLQVLIDHKQKQQNIFKFHDEIIQSFELQVAFLQHDSKCPENLAIVINLMDNADYRLKCLQVLVKFIDLCPNWIPDCQQIGIVIGALRTMYISRNQAGEITVQLMRLSCFILTKLFVHDMSYIKDYKLFRLHQSITDKDFLPKILCNMLKSVASSIDERLIALQLFTILTSEQFQLIFKDDVSADVRPFLQCTASYLLTNKLTPLLKAFSSSNDAKVRIWSTILVANLIKYMLSMPTKSVQAPIQSALADFGLVGVPRPRMLRKTSQFSMVMEDEGQKLLNSLNSQENFKELNELAMFYKYQMNNDNVPEVRAAAAHLISQIFPKLLDITAIQENSKDALVNWLDSSIYDALHIASNDNNPMVRSEVCNCLCKQMGCYFYSFSTGLSMQFQKKIPQKLFKATELPSINHIVEVSLKSICILQKDPILPIAFQAQQIFSSLNSHASILLLIRTKQSSSFFTAFQENLKDQNIEKHQYFNEHEVSIVRNFITDGVVEPMQLYEELTKKTDMLNNTSIVASNHASFSELSIKQEKSMNVKLNVNSVSPLENAVSGYSMEVVKYNQKQDMLKVKSDLKKSFKNTDQDDQTPPLPKANKNNMPKVISPIVKLQDNQEFDGINDSDSYEKSSDSNHSLELPVFAEIVSKKDETDTTQQSNESKLTSNNKTAYQIQFTDELEKAKFEFLLDKLTNQHEFDTIFAQISHNLHFNKIFITIGELRSSLFGIMIHSIKQQSFASNLIQLSQSIAQLMHRQLSACFNHQMVWCKDCGCMSNRIYNMKCQVCQFPSQGGIAQAYSETGVKCYSSCYSLESSQKQEFRKNVCDIKRVNSQGSKLCALVQKTFVKDDIKGTQQKQTKMQQLVLTLQQQVQKSDNQTLFYTIRLHHAETVQDVANKQLNKIAAAFQYRTLPKECESFIYGLPISDFTDSYQDEIVVQLNTLQSEKRSFNRAQPNKWIDAINLQKNAQSIYNKNIMQDGKIYRQYQASYDSPVIQQVFNQNLKVLQVFDPNLLNVDVQNLSQHVEQLNLLQQIDQSCPLCRNLAVRKGLLQKCATSNRKYTKSDKQNFLFSPTRDYQPLVEKQEKKKIFDSDKNQQNPISFQQFFQKYINQMASPFPYLDQITTCPNSALFAFDHPQLLRSIYRVCCTICDTLQYTLNIQVKILQDSSSSCSSVMGLLQFDFSDVIITENSIVTSFLNQIQKKVGGNKDQNSPQIRTFTESPSKADLSSAIPSTEFLKEDKYIQPEKSENTPSENVKQMFREQFVYLSNVGKVATKDVESYQYLMQQQIQYPIKLLKLHPTLPFVACLTEQGVVMQHIEKRLTTNIIDNDLLQDMSPVWYQDQLLTHRHTDLQAHYQLKPMSTLMQSLAPTEPNMYYAYLQDRDLEAQFCCICQSIKEQNQFSQPVRNYDLYDVMCAKARDPTQKYAASEQQQEFSEFFSQGAVPSQAWPRYLRNQLRQPPPQVSQLDFLNQRSTFPIIAVSSADSVKIVQNPFDFGCSRLTTSFRPFECQAEPVFDFALALPAVDCLRRVQYGRSTMDQNYVRNELFQIYVQNKIQTTLADYVELEQLATPFKPFKADYSGHHALFGLDKQVRLADMNREVTSSLGIKIDSPVTAISLSGTSAAVGEANGMITVVDTRSNKVQFQFKTESAIEALKIQENSTFLFSKDIGFGVMQGNQLITNVRTEPANVAINGGYGCISSTRGMAAHVNLVHQQKQELKGMKIDKFQHIDWRDDGQAFATSDGCNLRIYGSK